MVYPSLSQELKTCNITGVQSQLKKYSVEVWVDVENINAKDFRIFS